MEKSFTRELALETRKADTKERSVPAVISTTYPVSRGGFIEVLEHGKNAIDLSRQPLPLIESHDTGKVNIGLVESLRLDGSKLRGTVRFGTSARALELWEDVEQGIVRSVSVGYKVNEWDDTDNADPPTWRAIKWLPYEVSLVSTPADPNAGLNRSIHNMETNTPTLAATNEAEFITRERNRRKEIHRRCDRFMGDAQARSIILESLDDMSVGADEASLRVLEYLGTRATPTARPMSDQQRIDSTRISQNTGTADDLKLAMQHAILKRAGFQVKDEHPGARDFARRSLLDMQNIWEGQRGYGIVSHTSSDYSYLLGDSMNKALQMAMEAANPTFRQWCKISQHSDYHDQKRISLGSAPDLDQIEEAGEYTHGTVSEKQETFTPAKYGKMFSISREALKNDNLDAFSRFPRMFVAASVRKINELVYALLTANAAMAEDSTTLFHADHSNYIASGSGAAPSVTTLNAAFGSVRKQKAVGNVGYLNAAPQFLIVPTDLEPTARILTMAMQFDQNESPGAGIVQAVNSVNPYRNLEIIVSPELSDSSTTGWYLATNPEELDTVEVSFIDDASTSGITVEGQDSWNQDGYTWKCRLECACGVTEWRGLYWNYGA